MIARLLISPSLNSIKEAITQTLTFSLGEININHPDLLYIEAGGKLGIAEARKIKDHFSLKPYSAKGRIAVLEDASVLTIEAQNALLKTLEELPKDATIILGTYSDANLLPTILSRCQIIRLQKPPSEVTNNFAEDIEKLLSTNLEGRFDYVEKLQKREEFLYSLTAFFRQKLYALGSDLMELEVGKFLKELLQAEGWAKQKVNIRAILEYLMLVIPGEK